MSEKIKFCEECGHSFTEHLRNVNGVYCQRCEREGEICDWEERD